MAVVQTTTSKITCDICGKDISPKNQNEIDSAMEVPYAYFMEHVDTVRLRALNLCAPYAKTVKYPDLCAKCLSRILAKALDRVVWIERKAHTLSEDEMQATTRMCEAASDYLRVSH